MSPSAVRRWSLAVLIAVGTLLMGSLLEAHEGPPFPLEMDKSVGPYVVSIWADPDIGEATFYVQITGDGIDAEREEFQVSMSIQPQNGRLESMSYEGKRQWMRDCAQFKLSPHFDIQDQWDLNFLIQSDDNQAHTLASSVESTPPGLGPWDLAIYLFPFAFIGVVWASFMIRRHRSSRGTRSFANASPQAASDPMSSPLSRNRA